MAPKKSKADQNDTAALSEEQQAAIQTSKRLQELAVQQGMLSMTKKIVTNSLPLPKMLLKADEKDLVKKSTQRKGRYLLNICAQIAPATAGKMGDLAQLDSQNPVLYIDFPQGRLKFYGTIIFPKTNYMLLKFGQKDVLCEDIFENMIVFPEAHWIGTKEENPSEKQLPMPAELQTTVQQQKYSFPAEASQPATQPSQPEREAAADSTDDEHAEEDPGPSQGRRASGRLQGSKRPRYAEPGISDDELDAAKDSDEAEEPVLKLPKASKQATPSGSKQQQRRQRSCGTLERTDTQGQGGKGGKIQKQASKAAGKGRTQQDAGDNTSGEDEEVELPSLGPNPGRLASRQSTLPGFLSKAGNKKGKLARAGNRGAGMSAVADVIDLLSDDEGVLADAHSQDAGASQQPASSSRPRRARASQAKTLKESSSEDEGDDEAESVKSEEPTPSADDTGDEDYGQ